MGVEVREITTKDVDISEYIKGDGTYKVVVRRLTMKEKLGLRKLNSDDFTFDELTKFLTTTVIETPFERWDKEEIEAIDKLNPDLIGYIFKEAVGFNVPLPEKRKPS